MKKVPFKQVRTHVGCYTNARTHAFTYR